MPLTAMSRSQPCERGILQLVIRPIPLLTRKFWYMNSNVYTSYKGGCQDPGVDLEGHGYPAAKAKAGFSGRYLELIMQSGTDI